MNDEENRPQIDPAKFLPDQDELEDAADICRDYARYLKLTEPNATNSINALEEAANELDAAALYYGEDEMDDDEDSGESKRLSG